MEIIWFIHKILNLCFAEPLTQINLEEYVTKEEHNDIVLSMKQEIKDIKQQIGVISGFKQELQSIKTQQAKTAGELIRINRLVKNRDEQERGFDIRKIIKTDWSQEDGRRVKDDIIKIQEEIQKLSLQQRSIEAKLGDTNRREQLTKQIQSLNEGFAKVSIIFTSFLQWQGE